MTSVTISPITLMSQPALPGITVQIFPLQLALTVFLERNLVNLELSVIFLVSVRALMSTSVPKRTKKPAQINVPISMVVNGIPLTLQLDIAS